MYLNNDNKYLCSGCTACKAVCPVDAIEMVRDEEGFKYPKINKEKCIDCNLCKNVCPNVKKSSENEMIILVKQVSITRIDGARERIVIKITRSIVVELSLIFS